MSTDTDIGPLIECSWIILPEKGLNRMSIDIEK